MDKMKQILLWDFDGTLAYSENSRSNSLLGALNLAEVKIIYAIKKNMV